MYAWVVQMMHEMEPQFPLSQICLIFGDQGMIMQPLLATLLGIMQTCLLKGDYHHLIDEVFPAQFGIHSYTIIAGHLTTMLLGSQQQEWETYYAAGKEHLVGDAKKVSLLNNIHQNPQYYASWYLRKICGNLMLTGSAPAEQNHSSVVAHLGKGANWGIAEHLSHMLKRQNHLTKLSQEKENSRFVLTHRYKSKLGMDDEMAKKSLLAFAYDQLFAKEFCKSKKLQHLALDDETTKVFLPCCGQLMDRDKVVTIKIGDEWHLITNVAMRYVQREALILSNFVIVGLTKRLSIR
jgi:hypothetical protein